MTEPDADREAQLLEADRLVQGWQDEAAARVREVLGPSPAERERAEATPNDPRPAR